MRHPARASAAALLLSLAAACGAPVRGPVPKVSATPVVEADSVPSGQRGGAIVFNAGDLSSGGSLLEALAGRVPSMRVSRSDGCSRVAFRGSQSVTGSSEAHVWVDGNAASNSCILELLRRWDVHRVEIYPSGLVPRRGYPASATGSILVFTKGDDS